MIRVVLTQRGFLPVLAAEVVSGLGSMMTSLALPWFVLQTSGSTSKASAVLAAEITPMLLLGIPSGKVAARLGARRTLMLTQLIGAPLVAAIPLLHYAGLLSFPTLLALVFASGSLLTPFYAAQSVIVPDLVGEDERSTSVANALLLGASRGTLWLGPLTAGLVISLFDAPIVLLLDAATFVVGGSLLAFVPERHTAVDEEPESVLAGVRFISRDRIVRAIVGAQVLSQASFQALVLAVPVFAFVVYRSAAVAGVLEGAWGAGALAGSVLAVPLAVRRPAAKLAPPAWALQSLPLWVLVLPLPVAFLVAALVLSGIGNGIRNPPTIAMMLTRVPASVRAHAFAAASAFATVGGLIALLIAGPSLQSLGVRPTFALIAVASSMGSVIFIRSMIRGRSAQAEA